jgi:hypothetical protein
MKVVQTERETETWVTRHESTQWFSSCHTCIKMDLSIVFTVAILDVTPLEDTHCVSW